MVSGRVKKKQQPKQKKPEQTCLMLSDEFKEYVESVDLCLSNLDDRLNVIEKIVARDLVGDKCYVTREEFDKQLEKLGSDKVNDVSKISETMLNTLKQTTQSEKVSQWNTVEYKCQITLRAVKNALRLMRGISVQASQTSIFAYVSCQGRNREITLNFYSNEINLVYVRRNGKCICENYINTTQAAAAFVAVVMYYATR